MPQGFLHPCAHRTMLPSVLSSPQSPSVCLRPHSNAATHVSKRKTGAGIHPAIQVSRNIESAAFCNGWQCQRLSFSYGRDLRRWPWHVSAVGPGLDASISEQSKNDIRLDNVKIVIDSHDNDQIKLRVDLTGEETQKAFDSALTNLARTAPPIPGFRRMKGGKTSNVPKSFLLQMLGQDRVTKFLIQEVVSITIGGYVKKENLKVKTQFKTIQTAEELEAAFTPGDEFGFNAVVDIEKSDAEATSTSSS